MIERYQNILKNKKSKFFEKLLLLLSIVAIFTIGSCSTTKVLKENEYRLSKRKIKVDGDNLFNISRLNPYIKQEPNSSFIFGWNPFLNIYNWSRPDSNKLSDRFYRKIGVAPVIYDSLLTAASVENIEGHLKHIGYYNSTVKSYTETKKKRVDLTYEINLGKQFRIAKIVYSVPNREEFRQDFYADTSNVSIRIGDILSEKSLEEESLRSAAYLRTQGYFGFSKNNYFFEADTLKYPGFAILYYTIKEYTRNESKKNAVPLRKFYIGSVNISHEKNLKFSEKVLKKLNTVYPGQMYDEGNVSTTYARLGALKTFSGVNIEMTPVDTNVVDCSINLTQNPINAFKINLEGSSNSSGLIGISPKLNYYNRNIFHGGQWLNLGFMGNFQFKPHSNTRSNEFGFSVGLSFPKFLGLPYNYFKRDKIPRTEVNFLYNYQDRPEYRRNLISTSFGYTGSIKNKFFYQLYPLQMNVVRLFNLDSKFYETLKKDRFLKNAYQDHFDAGAGFTLFYTNNTSVNPKTTYHYYKLQLDASGNLLQLFDSQLKKNSEGAAMIWNTPYSQYVRAEVSTGKTIVFGKNNGQAVASRILMGIGHAYGNSSTLPFEKQFYSGGSNSLRGWQARGVGPGLSPRDTTFRIPSQTGDIKFEANLEYRFNMFWKIAGAVFVDAGNVWTVKNRKVNHTISNVQAEEDIKSHFSINNFGKSLAIDWGVGLRFDLNFILLRLDYGIRLHDPARRKGSRWISPFNMTTSDGCLHFGVGFPF